MTGILSVKILKPFSANRLIGEFIFQDEAWEEMLDEFEFRLALERKKRELRRFIVSSYSLNHY